MVDKSSYRLLKKLYREGEMTAEDVWSFVGHKDGTSRFCPQTSSLMRTKMIGSRDEVISDDGMKATRYFFITLDGMAFVENRRSGIRNFWIPYAITTAIAIASLLVSIHTVFQSAP